MGDNEQFRRENEREINDNKSKESKKTSLDEIINLAEKAVKDINSDINKLFEKRKEILKK